MLKVSAQLPAGWQQIETAGCRFLAFHTGAPPPAEHTQLFVGSDAVPVTVHGLDILDSISRELDSRRPESTALPSTIIAVEYPSRDLLEGIEGLHIIEEAASTMAGQQAWRMDLTHRHRGVALFTRRWVIDAGATTLEIAATCTLDHFSHFIADFDALEERMVWAA